MRWFEWHISSTTADQYSTAMSFLTFSVSFLLYLFLLFCAHKLSSLFRRLASTPASVESSSAAADKPPPPSGWLKRLTPPPVLGMLLVGVTARFVLDFMSDKSSSSSSAGNASDSGSSTVTLLSADQLVAWLLKLCKPFFNLSLGCIALDIGSHLNYHHLTRVKKPLFIFLCCFLPIVYCGMLFWFRFVSDVVLRPVSIEKRLRSLLYWSEYNEFKRLSAFVSNQTNLTLSTNTSIIKNKKSVLFDEYHLSPVAEHFIDSHEYYIRRTAWCFSVLLATITLERSSPEFLSSMSFTGVSDGFLPVFTLCITACQDVMGLLLFVIFSLLLQPVQEDNMKYFNGNVNLLNQFWRQGVENHFYRVYAEELSAVNSGNSSSNTTSLNHRFTNENRWMVYRPERRTIIDVLKGGSSAILLLCTIFISTGIASLVVIVLRRLLMSVLFGNLTDEVEEKKEEEETALHPPAIPLQRSLLLLITLSSVLELFSTYTHTELLLAAVLAGSVINFYAPCRVLELAAETTRTLNNIVLFTTAGLRVSIFTSSSSSSSGGSGGGEGSASLLRYIQWGIFLFACKVFFCAVGGNVGSSVAGVPKLVLEEQNTLQSRNEELPEEGEAPRPLVDRALVQSVCRYIGLALLTQLAISLTLNLRAKDEYNALLQKVFGFDFGSTQKTPGPLQNGIANSIEWKDVLLPMLPLTQTFIFYIISSIIVGPVLGVKVLNQYKRLAH